MQMKTEMKAICSTEDYEAALSDIARLWGAKDGTPEGDRLDALATLIDAYESDHYPFDEPDSVEAIKFRREQNGSSS
jgi:HTH-type transcriptional regulator/antitoxin HigA